MTRGELGTVSIAEAARNAALFAASVGVVIFVVPTESPRAIVSEASGIVTGSFSFWPVERQCEWDRADGPGTVVDTTTLAAGTGMLALVGAGMLLVPAARSTRD